MDNGAPPPGPPVRERGATSSAGRHAFLVAAGILLSRILGLVRQRVLARYFGSSDAADAFSAAFKLPNFLQNLFGEGVLSASFIPVYAGLLAKEASEEAERVAGAVLGLLALVTSVLVLLGIAATPALIAVIAPGFTGEKRDLTVQLVRILFPGAGLLVISAWCLGVLNSHRRFFVSYTAPCAWNVAIIAALVLWGREAQEARLAVVAAWASVVGSALQVAVQLPVVLRVAGALRPRLTLGPASVRRVVGNFVPVVTGRGVAQVSAYVDTLLASLLPAGSVAELAYAQVLYTLPVSLFGMAVSAAELPAMSSARGTEGDVAAFLRARLERGLERIAFFIVPSSAAFLLLGDVVAGTVYQSGRFHRADAVWVWGILAGSAVGLLAGTLGRLYASTFYALHDTRTPLRYAVLRVAVTTGLGYLFALHGPALLGLDPKWGVAGLTASAGLAGWLEFALLRRSLGARIGRTGVRLRLLAVLWGSALAGAACAWAVKLGLGTERPLVLGALALPLHAVVYFTLTSLLGVRESREILGRAARLVRRA